MLLLAVLATQRPSPSAHRTLCVHWKREPHSQGCAPPLAKQLQTHGQQVTRALPVQFLPEDSDSRRPLRGLQNSGEGGEESMNGSHTFGALPLVVPDLLRCRSGHRPVLCVRPRSHPLSMVSPPNVVSGSEREGQRERGCPVVLAPPANII